MLLFNVQYTRFQYFPSSLIVPYINHFIILFLCPFLCTNRHQCHYYFLPIQRSDNTLVSGNLTAVYHSLMSWFSLSPLCSATQLSVVTPCSVHFLYRCAFRAERCRYCLYIFIIIIIINYYYYLYIFLNIVIILLYYYLQN